MKFFNHSFTIIIALSLGGCYSNYDRDFNCPVGQSGSCQPLSQTYISALEQTRNLENEEFELIEIG